MDIYEYAKEFNADYYDFQTGYRYAIQEYNRAIKLGLPTAGIKVYDSMGNFLGYAQKKNDK